MAMRSSLRSHLEGLKSSRSWEHITEQIGMFCYTGLTQEEVRGGEEDKSGGMLQCCNDQSCNGRGSICFVQDPHLSLKLYTYLTQQPNLRKVDTNHCKL